MIARPLAALAVTLIAISAAEARPARCTTTDDGTYACDFRATDRKGSFIIKAPGKPEYRLLVEEPGDALGFLVIKGSKPVALPGVFRRDGIDPACWTNDVTRAQVCAR